jgi:hypothetical protein
MSANLLEPIGKDETLCCLVPHISNYLCEHVTKVLLIFNNKNPSMPYIRIASGTYSLKGNPVRFGVPPL